MKTNVVAIVNGVEILASAVSEELVPVRPVCEALGIAFQSQNAKLKEHPVYSSAVTLSVTTGADGKQYEMVCLPIEFFPGWLFSINPANVKEEAREPLVRFQLECNRALFSYFFGSQKKRIELDALEIQLLEEIAEIKSQKTALNNRLAEKSKLLEKLRDERLNYENSLFD